MRIEEGPKEQTEVNLITNDIPDQEDGIGRSDSDRGSKIGSKVVDVTRGWNDVDPI